jgi:hypothetical protein
LIIKLLQIWKNIRYGKKRVNITKILKFSSKSLSEEKRQTDFLSIDEWPVLNGVEYDDILGIPVTYTEQVVKPDEYKNPPKP